MANSKFRSNFIASKKVTAQVRMNNDTFNLNANTTWTEIPMTGTIDKVDFGYTVVGNGVKCLFTQWVDLAASIYLTSTVARSNVEIAFAINGTVRPVIGASSYIRNSNNHDHASCHLIDGFKVAKDDVITLVSRQEAASGTVTSPNGSAMMKLLSEAVVVPRGPAGTYTESFETSLGNWVNVGSADFIRYTGTTPSSGTGTVGTSHGSYYIYAEMSNDEYLETHTIQTSFFRYLRSVSFSYQMEGSDCGTFAFQYKDKNGIWQTFWSVSGTQGSSWVNVNLDLSSVADIDLVKSIRFTCYNATDYQADCLLDNISVVSV